MPGDICNLYIEAIVRHNKDMPGIHVGNINIGNVQYVDDTAREVGKGLDRC